jgi:hypothetical protein
MQAIQEQKHELEITYYFKNSDFYRAALIYRSPSERVKLASIVLQRSTHTNQIKVIKSDYDITGIIALGLQHIAEKGN